MARRSSPTDLTDDEWRVLAPLIPPAKSGGRPRSVEVREIVNALRYVLRSGGAWRFRQTIAPASAHWRAVSWRPYS